MQFGSLNSNPYDAQAQQQQRPTDMQQGQGQTQQNQVQGQLLQQLRQMTPQQQIQQAQFLKQFKDQNKLNQLQAYAQSQGQSLFSPAFQQKLFQQQQFIQQRQNQQQQKTADKQPYTQSQNQIFQGRSDKNEVDCYFGGQIKSKKQRSKRKISKRGWLKNEASGQIQNNHPKETMEGGQSLQQQQQQQQQLLQQQQFQKQVQQSQQFMQQQQLQMQSKERSDYQNQINSVKPNFSYHVTGKGNNPNQNPHMNNLLQQQIQPSQYLTGQQMQYQHQQSMNQANILRAQQQQQHQLRPMQNNTLTPVQQQFRETQAARASSRSRRKRRIEYEESEGDDLSEEEENAKKRKKNQVITQMAQMTGEDQEEELERVIAHRKRDDLEYDEFDPWGSQEFLVKWKKVSYIHCSWETRDTLLQVPGYKRVVNYIRRQDESAYRRLELTREEIESQDVALQMEEQLIQQYLTAERIISEKADKSRGIKLYLVKWTGLPYSECTWEEAPDIISMNAQKLIDDYGKREQRAFDHGKHIEMIRQAFLKHNVRALTNQPSYLVGGQLRDYQLQGLNWMIYAWANNTNGILADEMGLGKTIQCVALLTFLSESLYIKGPFLIVVPLSTIPNWIKEFRQWAPQINAVVYIGDSVSREVIRMYEFHSTHPGARKYKFEVLITTYEVVRNDATILSTIPWAYLIVDEAHRLKNNESALYTELRQWSFKNKLLVTGTPLQNSLKELWALLHFLEPQKYPDLEIFCATHNIHEQEGVSGLHTELRHHLLRRVIKDVEKSLPPKNEKILRVAMTPLQRQYYRWILSRNFKELNKGIKGGGNVTLLNIISDLKKCCNHPFLFDSAEEQYRQSQGASNEQKILVITSGKMVMLDKLLTRLNQTGHRILIFSQMVRVLDIISDYMKLRGFQFQRLDGSTPSQQRHQAMDHFNAPGSNDFAFLLSTRAGGLGINLATADTVIIFDSDWNPQNDLQAMSRAHRIGQQQTVNIYRFVTGDSVEEDILQRAKRKMVLDHLVIQRMDATGRTILQNQAGTAQNMFTKDELQSILKFGAEDLFRQSEEKLEERNKIMMEEDVDAILERAELVINNPDTEQGANQLLNQFNVQTFKQAEEEDDFWNHLIPEGERPQDEITLEELPIRGARLKALETKQRVVDGEPPADGKPRRGRKPKKYLEQLQKQQQQQLENENENENENDSDKDDDYDEDNEDNDQENDMDYEDDDKDSEIEKIEKGRKGPKKKSISQINNEEGEKVEEQEEEEDQALEKIDSWTYMKKELLDTKENIIKILFPTIPCIFEVLRLYFCKVGAYEPVDIFPKLYSDSNRVLNKRDASALIRAIKKWARIEKVESIFSECGDILSKYSLDEKQQLFQFVAQISQNTLQKAEEQGIDPSVACVDFFGVQYRASEIVLHLQSLQYASSQIESYQSPYQYRIELNQYPGNQKWTQQCGWAMREDSMLIVGFYLYGFANFEEIYKDPQMEMQDKLQNAVKDKEGKNSKELEQYPKAPIVRKRLQTILNLINDPNYVQQQPGQGRGRRSNVQRESTKLKPIRRSGEDDLYEGSDDDDDKQQTDKPVKQRKPRRTKLEMQEARQQELERAKEKAREGRRKSQLKSESSEIKSEEKLKVKDQDPGAKKEDKVKKEEKNSTVKKDKDSSPNKNKSNKSIKNSNTNIGLEDNENIDGNANGNMENGNEETHNGKNNHTNHVNSNSNGQEKDGKDLNLHELIQPVRDEIIALKDLKTTNKDRNEQLLQTKKILRVIGDHICKATGTHFKDEEEKSGSTQAKLALSLWEQVSKASANQMDGAKMLVIYKKLKNQERNQEDKFEQAKQNADRKQSKDLQQQQEQQINSLQQENSQKLQEKYYQHDNLSQEALLQQESSIKQSLKSNIDNQAYELPRFNQQQVDNNTNADNEEMDN